MIMEDNKMNNTKLNIINDELLKVVSNIINTKLPVHDEKAKEDFLNTYINHVENGYFLRLRKLVELEAPESVIKNEAYNFCDSMISLMFDVPLLSEEEKDEVYMYTEQPTKEDTGSV